MMKQLMVGALIILWLSGCAVYVVSPNPRVESPELRGDRGLKIGMDVTGANSYESSPDGSTRLPDITRPKVESIHTANAAFAWSPASPIEIGAELSPVHGLGAAGVFRWQILGEGTRKAEAGNVPLGVYVRAGDSFTHSNGDQDGLFGPGGYKWSANVNSGYIHSGISVGYRFTSNIRYHRAGASYGTSFRSGFVFIL